MRYLIIKYYTKPDGKIDESMTVAKNLKARDLQTASVILDFKTQKVEKSTLSGMPGSRDWDTVVSYYYQYYTNIIERLFEDNGHKIDIQVKAPSK